MSIMYCEYCDQHIDTDLNVEHFNENDDCITELTENPPLCGQCQGSGLGMHGENSKCYVCKGSGVIKYAPIDEDYDPTPCCYQHGVGAIGTNEPCPKIADND